MIMGDLSELEIWPSGFLLPSVDAHCLQFLACCRISTAGLKKVHAPRTPWAAPDGTYPVIKHRDRVFNGAQADQLVSYLRTNVTQIPLDHHLSAEEKAEVAAYQSLLKLKLEPAYLHSLWVDLPNYNVFTSRYYSKQLPIGYGTYYAVKQRRNAINYLHALYPGKLTGEENVEFAVTKQALLCVNLLSAKLGDQRFFLGDKPSSLDAFVFGYLAPLLKLPLPNDRLQAHIKACPNLVRLIDTMISVYLPLTEEEITCQRKELKEWEKRKELAQAEIQRMKREAKRDQQDHHHQHDAAAADEFPLRHKIMFAVGAVVLSLLVAVHAGLIQVEVRQVHNENGTNEGDDE